MILGLCVNSNETSQELQEVLANFQASRLAEEKKASQSESVLRKLSRKFTSTKDITLREDGDKPPAEKPTGLVRNLTRMLTRKITQTATVIQDLEEDDLVRLKRFHGVWDGVHPKNKPGNDELARVMGLGWGLRKALDNMPGISVSSSAFCSTILDLATLALLLKIECLLLSST